jgi:uncharacterized membrane protein
MSIVTNKFSVYLLGILLMIGVFLGLTLTPASAATDDEDAANTPTSAVDAVCAGLGAALDPDGSGDCVDPEGSASVSNTVESVINLLSVVVGVAAVIMIIIGGLQYVMSGGDSGKVGNSKNTILYAVVGLIVVALAQIIVKFTVNSTTSDTTTPTAGTP